MKLESLREICAYVFVSLLAVGMAAFLSLQFSDSVVSQESGETQDQPTETPSSGQQTEPDRPVFPQSEDQTLQSARELEVFLEPFIYDSGDRRDPFEPYMERAERGAPLGPLQRYSLDQLNLIGIMWDIRNPKAMFVDPNSMVHVVGRDEGIGQKNGYIAAIREGEVVVVEAERTEAGIVYETKVIQLAR